MATVKSPVLYEHKEGPVVCPKSLRKMGAQWKDQHCGARDGSIHILIFSSPDKALTKLMTEGLQTPSPSTPEGNTSILVDKALTNSRLLLRLVATHTWTCESQCLDFVPCVMRPETGLA